ncbi:hypothetical protein D3C77_746030 [compost metagenome]
MDLVNRLWAVNQVNVEGDLGRVCSVKAADGVISAHIDLHVRTFAGGRLMGNG